MLPKGRTSDEIHRPDRRRAAVADRLQATGAGSTTPAMAQFTAPGDVPTSIDGQRRGLCARRSTSIAAATPTAWRHALAVRASPTLNTDSGGVVPRRTPTIPATAARRPTTASNSATPAWPARDRRRAAPAAWRSRRDSSAVGRRQRAARAPNSGRACAPVARRGHRPSRGRTAARDARARRASPADTRTATRARPGRGRAAR